MGSLEGGPNPCRGAVEFSVGGARTVILIWRDDFNICTHLCVKKKCGNRRDTKERRKMQAKLTNDRKEQRERETDKDKDKERERERGKTAKRN